MKFDSLNNKDIVYHNYVLTVSELVLLIGHIFDISQTQSKILIRTRAKQRWILI
jgi:hypothetical protein